MTSSRHIFMTGATGFIGQALMSKLLPRGHRVRALVRPGSERKLPPGVTAVTGDPLKKESFAARISPADTFVQLVGVSHPSPTKANQFRDIDGASARASIEAAQAAGIRHFVYLSVASPAPIMQSYIDVRLEGEARLRASGMPATFVKPWYVLGPGRRWPLVVLPVYWILERLPATRASAERLGFVAIDQLADAVVRSIEDPPENFRILDVPAMRKALPLT